MATASKPNALPADIFAVEVKNHELLKLAYNAYLADSRTSAARTKTRGEISGGGKKPWRQKGTGRARFGSSRNPIWRGGGIVFGPRGNENYKLNISKTAKRVALRQALTLASQAGKIVSIESFVCPEGKVKETLKLLKDNQIADTARVLLVVEDKNAMVRRATNNLGNVKVISAMYLSVYDILNADKIVISNKALETVQTWLGDKS